MKDYTGDFKRDAQIVRNLAQKHLGHHRYAGGIYPQDVAVNKSLLTNQTPIPQQLGMPAFRRFMDGLGVKASDPYLRKFRNNAIMKMMGFEHGRERPTVATIAQQIADEVAG